MAYKQPRPPLLASTEARTLGEIVVMDIDDQFDQQRAPEHEAENRRLRRPHAAADDAQRRASLNQLRRLLRGHGEEGAMIRYHDVKELPNNDPRR